ncbi:MAG: shikimate kinase [Anaerovoracaceae bacterium]|nr:shikimate kinase [Anaerovoracaceae bacterium]
MYGLVGEKLAHSYSGIIHEKFGYDYGLFEIPKQDFASFIRARDFDGLNVTIPYKRDVIPLLDRLEPAAEKIGAVNTLYFDGDKLVGANTDYTGFLYMADRAGVSFGGKNVLLLGTGGASLMVQQALTDSGAGSITVASRRDSAAVKPGAKCVTYRELGSDSELSGSIDIIVNATPVGTYPDCPASAVDLSDFPHCESVLDLIYNPFRTGLLLQAERRGLKYSNGLPMLVAQAAAASELWTGEERMSSVPAITAELAGSVKNIVIAGMPGSGKSSVGRAAAEMLGRSFIDTDDEIEKRTGRSPAMIITEDGEPAFRRIESEVLRECCRERGLVIATGGGAVTVPENIDYMRQNGDVVYLARDVSRLASKGRPLSGGIEKRKELLKKRLPMYREASDLTVENNGSIESAAAEIIARTARGSAGA